MYKSTEWLYLDRNNRVVKRGDPRARRLLVAAGCSIPDDVARRYGLIKDEPAPPETTDAVERLRAEFGVEPARKSAESPSDAAEPEQAEAHIRPIYPPAEPAPGQVKPKPKRRPSAKKAAGKK